MAQKLRKVGWSRPYKHPKSGKLTRNRPHQRMVSDRAKKQMAKEQRKRAKTPVGERLARPEKKSRPKVSPPSLEAKRLKAKAKREEKRKQQRRAWFKRQGLILAYRMLPPLRNHQAKRWQRDQKNLEKEYKAQKLEAGWVVAERDELMMRELDILEAQASGHVDPAKLQRLVAAQRQGLLDWQDRFATYNEREEILQARTKELNARGKVLVDGGYEAKAGSKGKKKTNGGLPELFYSPPRDRDHIELRGLAEAPGKGTESVFDSTWDLLFEDWALPSSNGVKLPV